MTSVALHVLGAALVMGMAALPLNRPALVVGVLANAVLWPGREWAQNGPPWEWGSSAIPEALAPVAAALIFWGLIELWRKARRVRPMASIRERIESLQSVTQFAEILQAGEEWQAGNLIPTDEMQARIDSAVSEAVREERDRCELIAKLEGRHSALELTDIGKFHHQACEKIASAIRKEP